jgi:hypothetical protein
MSTRKPRFALEEAKLRGYMEACARESWVVGQNDLFRARLDQIVDVNHAQAKLARAIDWAFSNRGSARPMRIYPAARPLPTRLMAGLAILKHRPFRRRAVRALDREPLLLAFLRRRVLPSLERVRRSKPPRLSVIKPLSCPIFSALCRNGIDQRKVRRESRCSSELRGDALVSAPNL